MDVPNQIRLLLDDLTRRAKICKGGKDLIEFSQMGGLGKKFAAPSASIHLSYKREVDTSFLKQSSNEMEEEEKSFSSSVFL